MEQQLTQEKGMVKSDSEKPKLTELVKYLMK